LLVTIGQKKKTKRNQKARHTSAHGYTFSRVLFWGFGTKVASKSRSVRFISVFLTFVATFCLG